MGQEARLASIRCATVDSSPFIYLFEGSGQRYERAIEMFRLLSGSRTITSIITPIEILTYCVREKEKELEATYLDFFQNTPRLTVFPVNWPIGAKAVHLRAKYRFTTPDAIQVATALVNEADVFITNDRRLAGIEEIPVVMFDEWTP